MEVDWRRTQLAKLARLVWLLRDFLPLRRGYEGAAQLLANDRIAQLDAFVLATGDGLDELAAELLGQRVVLPRANEKSASASRSVRTPRGLGMVMRDGMKLVGLGLVLGGVAAALLTRVVASLLWGVSSTNAATYVVIAAVLAAVALVAIVIPAQRATRVDPMQALRSE